MAAPNPPDVAPVAPPGPDLTAVQAALGPILAAPELGTVTLGLLALDLATGAEIASVQPDTALNPASNEKLPTTATALARLGADFRFRSQLLRAGATIFLRGGGDPTLTTSAVKALIAQAEPSLRGTKFAAVIVDEDGFTGAALPPGFDKKTTDAAFRAATGMTVLDEGTIRIELSPTRIGDAIGVEITPPGDYTELDNRGKTVAGKISKVGIETGVQEGPAGSRTTLIVRGRLGVQVRSNPVTVRRAEAPSLLAAAAVHALLRAAGIAVSGPARIGSVPDDAVVLAERESAPLSEIIQHINKTSSNFGAEMALRAIAVHACRVLDGAVSPCPGGASWEQGTTAVRGFLEQEIGLRPESFEFTNGSGLYDGGRISARSLVTLLARMHQRPEAAAFEASLSIAGQDGTLAGRLTGVTYAGRVRGKTGTLDDVSTLAGLLRTRGERTVAFAILMNRAAGKTSAMRRVQDKLVKAMIDHL